MAKNTETVQSDVAKFAVNTLHQYAHESGALVRATTDLSPLEQWLLVKLFNIERSVVKGMTGREILERVCRDNSYLLDEPEIKDIERILDDLLKGTTIEQFNEIKDLRSYFLQYPDKDELKTACLHFLGDKAQRDYHYNGWHTYRMEYDNYKNCHVTPSVSTSYLVMRRSGKVHFAMWDELQEVFVGCDNDVDVGCDNDIEFWQDVPNLQNVPKRPK